MAVHHTFFAASEDELDRLFPGFRRAKPEKVTREGVNPFTKRPSTHRAWEPIAPPTALGSPSFLDDVWGPAFPPVVASDSEYSAALDAASPPGLRALPHVVAKDLPILSIEPLAAALLGADVPSPPARMGLDPRGESREIEALPDAAVIALAEASDAALVAATETDAIARAIATGPSVELSEEEARDELLRLMLRPLRALAIEARSRHSRVCHYCVF